MQGKDLFLALLGVFILGVTFVFCGSGAKTAPPPVASQNRSEIPPPAPKNLEPPSSSTPAPLVAATAVLKKKIDHLLIGNPIAFRLNSAILLPEGKTALNGVAAILQEDPTVAFEVGGHTDNVGPEQSNWVLSEQRAKAVVEYLVSQGIAADRLTPKGYGASRPIADSATDEGRWQNRRIEFAIGAKGEQP
ncbi:MAG: OmpA family protein [Nitrospira sp.]|nr:OmpA family protein [Nitrospira sp.]MDH4303000.1 OmpA family protein [Nitrospira sp.]MDH5192810.1 OmpA family protein [Nitrospira sp.]